MAFRIEITAVNFSGRDRQGGEKRKIIREEMYKGVLAVVFEMRKVLAVENSPVVSGKLKQSWQTNTNILSNQIIGRVGTNEVSAKVFESGAKKHFPPVNTTVGARLPGQRGRNSRGAMSTGPALAPWIVRAPGQAHFRGNWRKFDISKPRDVYRLAFVIGRKFKALGRRKELRFSRALERAKMRFAVILKHFMRVAADRIQRRP